MENTLPDRKMTCSCVHHKMLPVLIMMFGGAFLLLRLDVLTEDFVSLAWPVIVIAAGAVKLSESKCKCC